MCLVKSEAIHCSSQYVNLVKRAYWICVFQERAISIEFCVADTGIETLANLVQMPHFPDILFEEQQSRHAGDLSPRGSMVPQENDYAYHFSATTALGRLIRRANDIVHEREPVLHGRPSEVSVAHAKDEFSVKIWNSSNMMEFPFSSCERWPKNSTLAGLAWHTSNVRAELRLGTME